MSFVFGFCFVFRFIENTTEQIQMAPCGILKFIPTEGWVTCMSEKVPEPRSIRFPWCQDQPQWPPDPGLKPQEHNLASLWSSSNLRKRPLTGPLWIGIIRCVTQMAILLGSFLLGIMVTSSIHAWCRDYYSGVWSTSWRWPGPPLS